MYTSEYYSSLIPHILVSRCSNQEQLLPQNRLFPHNFHFNFQCSQPEENKEHPITGNPITKQDSHKLAINVCFWYCNVIVQTPFQADTAVMDCCYTSHSHVAGCCTSVLHANIILPMHKVFMAVVTPPLFLEY